ncbi:MAG: DUF3108 domain-containing protein [Nevskiaceae bacterium]|nr:DUF3108 domain-containing protein [Nevskiaceae bacterium]
MKRIVTALAASLLATGLLAAEPAAEPAPTAGLREFQATFSVKFRGMNAGQSQLQLEKLDGDRWRYSSRSQAKGLFRLAVHGEPTQISVLQMQDGAVRPLEFTSAIGANDDDRDQSMKFDWQAGRVTGTAEGKPVDIALQPGMHDAASVQVAMMLELLAGRTPERFQMIDKTQVKDYIYTREGEETLDTALGKQQTVIFRSARPDSTRGTLFWCAPGLGFLPVKVERRNGNKVEWSMTLNAATFGTS